MDPFDWLLVPLILALAIQLLYLWQMYTAKIARERNQVMERWGREHGLKILDRPASPRLFGHVITGVDDSKTEPLMHLQVLKSSIFAFFSEEARYSHNFLEGKIDGRTVWVFDHRVIIRKNKSRHSIDHTLAAVALAKEAPTFALRAQGFWDNVSALFGQKDYQVGDPDFDKKYHISTADRQFMRRLFDKEVRDLFFYHDELTWHCSGLFAVCVAEGQCRPEDLSRMLEYATFLAEKVDEVD